MQIPHRRYRWVKEWVSQELVVAGGPCVLYKWVREDRLAALKAKDKKHGAESATPEPNSEVLFLCSYEGCGKTFFDAGALRKHAHVHGERQYICHYENCGKKFLDSSKLKRHFLIHTGEKNFVCPHEGCGKAFSLDFNLKAHMKTHSADNYHVCQYPECGRRFTQESKLRAHIRAQHEKNPGASAMNHSAIGEQHQPPKPAKVSATPPAPSAERPYVCPYDGCDKAYIHEYKLNLHLKKEHPNHYQDGGPQGAAPSKRSISKSSHRSRPDITARMPPAKVSKRKGGYAAPSPAVNLPEEHLPEEQQWPRKVMYEDDSEETEEEEGGNNVEDRWNYNRAASSDDEETEDEQ
ncbi:putative zinc finger protein [Zea mays]|uniref:Putative zinc finger protein n=1 Tax=Zea mays TaxID=4577 RepID=A0A3L6EPA8_MAIZE|nr:putative zinc finger protein [Zea mays]